MDGVGRLRIGHARVDFNALSITHDNGDHCSVEPKVMDVLRALVGNHGEVVARDTIIDTVWGVGDGSDERLTRAVSLLRKALGEAPDRKHYIQTIPKRGYSLTASIQGFVNTELSAQHSESAPLSIAVLPFSDMSDEKGYEHFCDGVSEEIINWLTQVSEFKISGRTSSFSFKGKNQDLREIAQALNVAYLLEGSVRKFDDEICITAQLIQGDQGFHLWSSTYRGSLNDCFNFQETVADNITTELCRILDVKPEYLPQKKYINAANQLKPKAFADYLRGKQMVHQLNGQTTIPTGIDFLTKAVTREPDFYEAWAWLALGHFVLPEFSKTAEWAIHIEKSRIALDKALHLNPESSVALLVKAMHLTRELRFDTALATYEKALTIDPNNIETLAGMGLGLMAIGLNEQAKPYFDRVIAQDPLCGIWHTTYGGILLSMDKTELAEESFLRSFNLGFGAAAFGVSRQMACRGEAKAATQFMQNNFSALGPVEAAELRFSLVRKLVFKAYLERAPIAKKAVELALKRRLRKTSAQPTAASVISFLFLDSPDAFLRNIIEKPNPYLGYTVARIWEPTPESKRVRMHPDFTDFVNKSGLVNAWQKYGWPTQICPSDDSLATESFTVLS